MTDSARSVSVDERRQRGKHARTETPPGSHVGWQPTLERADPVALLREQNADREADLVPVRHGRMMVSPFTFYRGAAKIMASDLSGTPTAGLTVQLCGDAHLSNFGLFASPERMLLFDVNDFDETLPGPFEYDVKRLAASFTIAARCNGFAKAESRAVTATCVRAYREAMVGFAGMGVLDMWYARMSDDDALRLLASRPASKDKKRILAVTERTIAKARTHDHLDALSKLCEVVDGEYRIVSQPPIVIPARDVFQTFGTRADAKALIERQLLAYRKTLRDDRRHLLEKFQLVDVARKVVGVGSVGTRAYIGLLEGRDQHDPLFLQVKEATSSVLEAYLPPSRYANHGQRVVSGQRMMQAASDQFLGWTETPLDGRHYYWRQLRDMKGSADVETMNSSGMATYAQACGWTLARAHARSGDPIAIAAYLGKSDRFDRSIVDFSQRYADRNEGDYQRFLAAIRSGELVAHEGV